MITTNGNALIHIEGDGTRTISFDDVLQLDWPLNIDIRVMTRCSFGLNPNTGRAFCSFCHESARTDGDECNYGSLKDLLKDAPRGIELAIGSNELTDKLIEFLQWCKERDFICNLTVNQGHLLRDHAKLITSLRNGLIKGLGISYRSELNWNIPKDLLEYKNTVFHVIAGIDSIEEVLALKDKGVKKVLVLGEKDFGFNEGRVNLLQRKNREWYWWVNKLYTAFQIVSFDNLAIEQMNIKRFFTDEDWQVFNQGEYSFYINAVEGYFSPSSRNKNKTLYKETTIQKYFKSLQ